MERHSSSSFNLQFLRTSLGLLQWTPPDHRLLTSCWNHCSFLYWYGQHSSQDFTWTAPLNTSWSSPTLILLESLFFLVLIQIERHSCQDCTWTAPVNTSSSLFDFSSSANTGFQTSPCVFTCFSFLITSQRYFFSAFFSQPCYSTYNFSGLHLDCSVEHLLIITHFYRYFQVGFFLEDKTTLPTGQVCCPRFMFILISTVLLSHCR